MNSFLLTIIIPHFNTPALLEKLLESIPEIPEIQTIVIDDRTDIDVVMLRECIKYFQKQGVEFYFNKEKKGAGTCRNLGIEKALGKWILFADADDFFVPDFYMILKKYFELDADIIYFVPTSKNLDTEKVGSRHLPYKRLVQNYLKNKNIFHELQLR